MLVLAGNLRASNSISFVSEYWKIPDAPDEFLPLMFATRFIGRKMSVDLGGLFFIGPSAIWLPIMNFAYYL